MYWFGYTNLRFGVEGCSLCSWKWSQQFTWLLARTLSSSNHNHNHKVKQVTRLNPQASSWTKSNDSSESLLNHLLCIAPWVTSLCYPCWQFWLYSIIRTNNGINIEDIDSISCLFFPKLTLPSSEVKRPFLKVRQVFDREMLSICAKSPQNTWKEYSNLF